MGLYLTFVRVIVNCSDDLTVHCLARNLSCFIECLKMSLSNMRLHVVENYSLAHSIVNIKYVTVELKKLQTKNRALYITFNLLLMCG